jgi:hypothetical protein
LNAHQWIGDFSLVELASMSMAADANPEKAGVGGSIQPLAAI